MTLVTAHRGGGEVAPRGSWEAYQDSVALGVDLVEVDVRRAPDGEFVCAHDAVTGGEPRLKDVLALAADGAIGCHVDLKESGYEAELVDLVSGYGLPRVWFTTGDDLSVAALRSAGGNALLTLGPDFAGRPLHEVIREAWRAAVPFGRIRRCGARGVAAQFRLAWPGLRWWCGRNGLDVLVWTVNDDRRLRRFSRARGVNAVVTDRPHRALSLR